GYETAAFTANPWTSRFYGYDRDFDSFEDFMAGDLSSRFIAEGKPRGPIAPIVQLLNWWQGQDMFMSWEAFYDDVLAWLADADRPYFLWLFLVDVHTPYLPPAEHLSRSRAVTYLANLALFFGGTFLPLRSVLHGPLVDAYEDTIRHVDRFVDRLTTDLEALGEEPLVVLTADHGEAFGEEPVFGETDVYGHGNGVAEHQLHVPLVVLNGPSGSVRRPFPVRRLPALLTTLATGGDLESLLEPVAWARTYDPAVLVRGADWRYAWSPTDERVTVRSGDGWTEVDHPELAFVGRRLVDRALEGERERRRIRDATADVAATAAL
ncbi:MAG: sulfatase-like hydrolase/transferase, partial [Planctomycetota bacterium]